MRAYRLSQRADRSLRKIAIYFSEQLGETDTAVSFVAALRDQCGKLAMLPGEIGRPRPDLGQDCRSFIYRNYVIVFRYGAGTIDILDVVHSRRDRSAYR